MTPRFTHNTFAPEPEPMELEISRNQPELA
jgi:hypothetical protein